MFVGHYGPAAALAGDRVKLWHGVVAVQFLDILWVPLILAGIEKMRVVENFTASNHLDLYHMPWTHSLPMALVWSVIAGAVFMALSRRAGLVGGLVIAALVFSHWILDFLTHKPDLELWFGGEKVGLGLWENRPLAVSLELGLFVVGLGIYLMRTVSKGMMGKVAPAALLIVGVALQLYGNFAPPPSGPTEMAGSALIAYAVFIALAMWIDGTREAKG